MPYGRSRRRVADGLAYAMRFNKRGKARRTDQEFTAQVAVDELVHQMHQSGYVILPRLNYRVP